MCTFKFRLPPNRCTNVTAPHSPPMSHAGRRLQCERKSHNARYVHGARGLFSTRTALHFLLATRIGYFAQEPEMGDAKTVAEGVAETRALLTRFEEISNKLGEPMDDDAMTKLLDEQAQVRDKIDVADAWNLDRHVELAMDALRVPPGDATSPAGSSSSIAARVSPSRATTPGGSSRRARASRSRRNPSRPASAS